MSEFSLSKSHHIPVLYGLINFSAMYVNAVVQNEEV